MTLCDTGPLVAMLIEADMNHTRCLELLPTLRGPLVTTWACIAEAMHLLHRYGGHSAQDELWSYLNDGLLRVHIHTDAEKLRMRSLMRQFADTPMDLADASLVAAAETLQTRRIFTLDSDFYVYRRADGNTFEVVPAR